jgi:transketolase
MRTAFIEALIASARTHPDIFLVVGDLGFSVVEPFAREFPDRFLNAGIAEQNMMGLAAGLASEGYHVFTYSIANFPTLRCIEQFRNDVCYHNFSVTIVAVGAGLAYGNLGYSHHAVQDIACLRGMPNIQLMSPCDPGETKAALRHLVTNPGPSYLRLGKAGEPELRVSGSFGRGPILVAGSSQSRQAVVATGSILSEALRAASSLEDVAVYSMPVLAPVIGSDLEALWQHGRIITVEEHVRQGGLGELISGFRPVGVRQSILSINSDLSGIVGSQQFLRQAHNIDHEAIRHVLAEGA